MGFVVELPSGRTHDFGTEERAEKWFKARCNYYDVFVHLGVQFKYFVIREYYDGSKMVWPKYGFADYPEISHDVVMMDIQIAEDEAKDPGCHKRSLEAWRKEFDEIYPTPIEQSNNRARKLA